MAKILLLPGDGIGVEVVEQARRVIEVMTDFELTTGYIGGAAYDKFGSPLPDETVKQALDADAVLMGAVGGPKWDNLPFDKKPERGLLGIRKKLGLFANLRPAQVFSALAEASTLKKEIVENLDIMIVRELTGDVYFGEPRGIETLPDGRRRGFNTMVYTSDEVIRVARVAFDLARKRQGRVCSVDKANVLESTLMWREEVIKLHATEYKDIELSHMYVDNAAMQLIRNPRQFDVMVTTNIFGDILSDAASMLTGSLGMLPSASLGEKQANGRQAALYEPIHGSAPDIAGQNRANPLATILSVAMMFRHSFDMKKEADALENAVKKALEAGFRTGDIMQPSANSVTCSGMGDIVIQYLEKELA